MSDWVGSPDAVNTRGALLGRRGLLRFMMLTATVAVWTTCLVACGGPEAAPASPGSPQVVFFAEGSGTASAAVTMRTESGGSIQMDVGLPMTNAQTGKPGIGSDKFKRGDPLSILLRNSEGGGSVTCRIEVDGKVIDEATSSGAYKVVTCVGKVP